MTITTEQKEYFDCEIGILEKEIKELDSLITKCTDRKEKLATLLNYKKEITKEVKAIPTNDSDVVGLGSKFEATLYFSKREPKNFQFLISEMDIEIPYFKTILMNSPLAIAALNKKEYEPFNYKENGMDILCIIKKIIKEKELDSPKVKRLF